MTNVLFRAGRPGPLYRSCGAWGVRVGWMKGPVGVRGPSFLFSHPAGAGSPGTRSTTRLAARQRAGMRSASLSNRTTSNASACAHTRSGKRPVLRQAGTTRAGSRPRPSLRQKTPTGWTTRRSSRCARVPGRWRMNPEREHCAWHGGFRGTGREGLMSAPRTNAERQKRRHIVPLLGLLPVVALAVGLILHWQFEEAALGDGSGVEEPPDPGASPEVGPGSSKRSFPAIGGQVDGSGPGRHSCLGPLARRGGSSVRPAIRPVPSVWRRAGIAATAPEGGGGPASGPPGRDGRARIGVVHGSSPGHCTGMRRANPTGWPQFPSRARWTLTRMS